MNILEELDQHNMLTFNSIAKHFESANRTCVTDCTGLGKSMIAAAVIDKLFPNKRVLFITRSNRFLENFKKKLDKYGIDSTNIELTTYPVINFNRKNGNIDHYVEYDLIVVDEFHHIGAPQWGDISFKTIVNNNPDAKILGMSATPEYKDRDLIKEYFDNNIASNIDLTQAIKLGVIPKPNYVATLLSISDYMEKQKEQLEKILEKYPEKKEKAKAVTDEFHIMKVDWEKSYGYEETLKNYLPCHKDRIDKIIVFCKDIEHIKTIRKSVDPVFTKVYNGLGKAVVFGEWHSKQDNDSEFLSFENAEDKDTVRIIYVVDKFNESIHIKNLSAVILIRETMSKKIYLQQIGRVLSSRGVEDPVIIDFVDNYKALETLDMWQSIFDGKSNRGVTSRSKVEYLNTHSHVFYNLTLDLEKLAPRIDSLIGSLKHKTYEAFGEFGTAEYFARKYKKNLSLLKTQLNKGKSMEEALNDKDNVKGYVYDDIFTYTGKYSKEPMTGSLEEIAKNFEIRPNTIYFKLLSLQMWPEEYGSKYAGVVEVKNPHDINYAIDRVMQLKEMKLEKTS